MLKFDLLKLLSTLCLMAGANTANAEGCPARAQVSVFHSCEIPAVVDLQFHPLNLEHAPNNILSVTGAYSSADRFGVEGLAVDGERLVSSRFQGWDGFLLVSAAGKPRIFNASNIQLDGRAFDLKRQPNRRDFVTQARADGYSLIQSHLLIVDGALDVRQVENARRFVRRMFFTDSAGWGVYETKSAVTLYDAALEIQEALNPDMVMNLDMGAYNYCQQNTPTGFKPCGDLFTNAENLTNLITIQLPKTN
jgi:hypothetical protein